jgi:septum formation protein
MRVILASTSATRARLLRDAGIDIVTCAPTLDERTVAQLDPTGAAVAQRLAELKALTVAAGAPDALVIGADQTLELDGRLFNKPGNRAAAAVQLAALAGRTHRLHSAVAVARGNAVQWRHVASVPMTMRRLAPEEIAGYLDRAGAAALQSVGAYLVEGPGITLFDQIGSDWFAILGLPLLPLLGYLRGVGALG